MNQQRMIERFNGKPITQLNWWELIQYNRALASLATVSGNTDCGQAADLGLTWEYEQPTQQTPAAK